MPPKNKTSKSEIYWAIRYNICAPPLKKTKNLVGGGGVHEMGGNVREVAIQERVQRQKNQGWWWYNEAKIIM